MSMTNSITRRGFGILAAAGFAAAAFGTTMGTFMKLFGFGGAAHHAVGDREQQGQHLLEDARVFIG